MNETAQNPKLGIIAGSGHLPKLLIDTCCASGRDFFVLAFEGITDCDLHNIPHSFIRLGAVGDGLQILHQAGVQEIVLAGRVSRPSLSNLKPDATAVKLLGRMGVAFFSGDNTLLKSIIAFIESEGFRIVGSDQIVGGLITPEGVLGEVEPTAQNRADIAQATKVAKILGDLDIGQAVIVENGYVLGVEAAEGTDQLIARCISLKRESRAGVLVKMCKPSQEQRVDLPAVGAATVENVAQAGLCGIAIEAGGSILLNKSEVVERANALGIFIVGIRHG